MFPEDIAEAAYFFAAEHLSGKCTGNIVNVDAGNLARSTGFSIQYRLKVFSRFSYNCHDAINRHTFTLFYAYVQEYTIYIGHHFHGGFVRFHIGYYIVGLYGVTYFFVPFCNHTFLHRIAQQGHTYCFCHSYCGLFLRIKSN